MILIQTIKLMLSGHPARSLLFDADRPFHCLSPSLLENASYCSDLLSSTSTTSLRQLHLFLSNRKRSRRFWLSGDERQHSMQQLSKESKPKQIKPRRMPSLESTSKVVAVVAGNLKGRRKRKSKRKKKKKVIIIVEFHGPV